MYQWNECKIRIVRVRVSDSTLGWIYYNFFQIRIPLFVVMHRKQKEYAKFPCYVETLNIATADALSLSIALLFSLWQTAKASDVRSWDHGFCWDSPLEFISIQMKSARIETVAENDKFFGILYVNIYRILWIIYEQYESSEKCKVREHQMCWTNVNCTPENVWLWNRIFTVNESYDLF